MDYPQKFCGQTQSHYPHRWSDVGIGFSMYKNCAGYAPEVTPMERGRQLASEREDLIAGGVDPKELLIPLAPIESSTKDEPPPDPDDTMTNEERVRAAVESVSEENNDNWQYLRSETVNAITQRVLEALNAKPLENAWYRGPNFMMYLMDRDGVCLMSAPVNSPVTNGDTIQFPPIKVSL